MRYLPACCLFVLLSSLTAAAQILPTSNGSCGIGASGVMSCDWMSGISLQKDAKKITDTAAAESSKLFVTRCILAPGAPLNPRVEGNVVLIVGMNNGELVNEKKSATEPRQCFKRLSDVDAEGRAVSTMEYWKRES
jgi:hypothetical protein